LNPEIHLHRKLDTLKLKHFLHRHEIAFAFFESDAYVIKEFSDRKSIDHLIDEMISAESMFGTMGANVLRWGRNQLAKVEGRYHERVCIIMSDLGFFDIPKVAAEIQMLKQMDTKVIIILPPAFIYRSSLDVIGKAGCTVIELDGENIARFPEIIGEVI